MLRLLLILITCLPCVITCPYPDDLVGEWYSTSFGTLTFTSTSFSGFTSPEVYVTPLTFSCYGRQGTQYASISPVVLFGTDSYFYLCMNLVRVSSIKYYFTLDSNLDANGVRYFTSTSPSATVGEVCSFTDTRSPGEFELLILKASLSEAFISCPGEYLSYFNVTMTTSTSTDCENTTLDGRSDTALSFNYSTCASGTLNSGGTLHCLYNVVSGNGYLITYNNDTSTDETSTFRFTCFTYSKTGDLLKATEHPQSCHTNQSTTYVNSPGVVYSMTDIYYVPPTEKKSNLGLILGLVFGIIVVIVLIVIGIILYRKYCMKKPEPPPPPKIRKKKRKLSITDYSPNLSARGAQFPEDLVMKESAGEILTKSLISEQKTPQMNYEPLGKEKWQKHWENTHRSSTPLTSTSSSGRTYYNAQNGFSPHKSKGALTSKSTSLPDHLDSSHGGPGKSIQRDNLKIEALDLETPRSPTHSERYSERSHATPRLPESTGKFGVQSTYRSDGTVFMPNILQTIKEDPLSRENTELLKEHVAKTPKTFTSFNRPYSGLTASQSTISAGDIRLGTLSKTSRYSHLSASNESIFDDPRWMTRSVAESENAFEVGKNLLPGLPRKSAVLDPNAFIKIPVTTSREDFDYTKSKTMRSVGIKVSSTQERCPSSKTIVEDEKKRRKRNGETTKPKIVRPSPISTHIEDKT